MGHYSDLLAPICGLLAVVGLLVMVSVVAAGRRRRRQWIIEVERIDKLDGRVSTDQTERARRAQRTSDFLNNLSRRIYYAITIFSAIGLIILPFIPLEQTRRLFLYLALNATTFIGALLLLFSWHGMDDARERFLRRRLRLAQENALARRGLSVRDQLTHLHTPEYWVHILELELGKFFRRQVPITCLIIEVSGLAKFRDVYGDEAADRVLVLVGRMITRSVRVTDLVCRYRDQQFAIALFRCPAKFGNNVGERVTSIVARMVLNGINRHYQGSLHLSWKFSTLPDDAPTPVLLLHITEKALVKK